jgi:hypothetical protein
MKERKGPVLLEGKKIAEDLPIAWHKKTYLDDISNLEMLHSSCF